MLSLMLLRLDIDFLKVSFSAPATHDRAKRCGFISQNSLIRRLSRSISELIDGAHRLGSPSQLIEVSGVVGSAAVHQGINPFTFRLIDLLEFLPELTSTNLLCIASPGLPYNRAFAWVRNI